MRRCWFNILAVLALLTVVWGLFILVSVSLANLLFQDSAIELILRPASVTRVVVGVAAFLAWVYVWKRLAEFLLYRVLLRRGAENG